MPSFLSARTTAAPSPLPTATPSSAPNTEITTASTVTIRMVCARRSPIARSSPSSRVRSRTDRASVLTMPRTAIRIASASRTWIIVSTVSNWAVCCAMNPLRSATFTSGLSASSASTCDFTVDTGVPAASRR